MKKSLEFDRFWLIVAALLLSLAMPAGTKALPPQSAAGRSADSTDATSPIDDVDDPNTMVDPALFQALHYRSIGPYRGGRSTAATGVPSQPFTFYMGATGGGVWKTTNAGQTWANISDGFFEAGSIGSIAVADSDPNVVYVGTGSACPRGNVSAGVGAYRSTDAGRTWTHIGLRDAGQIGKIRVHPDDPDLVYAAVLGHIFGPNEGRGVFRSKDGGDTWEKVLFVSERTGFVDLSMNPKNPREIYAAAWTVERKPWAIVSGSDEGGLWKTTDGGDTWEKLGGGLPTNLVGKAAVAVSAANPDRVWVLIEAPEDEGGVYRSDDAGKSWRRINGERMLRQRAWYYTHIYADPQDANTVYALNTSFYKSTDGGMTFESIPVGHGDCHDLWLNPNHPEILIQANDGGAHVSLEAGKSWSSLINQPTAEFYRVFVDDQFPYRVYGPQQDNSTITVPSRANRGITPFQDWYSVGGCESGHIAIDPRDPDVVYAGCYGGTIDRFDGVAGVARNVEIYPEQTLAQAARNLKYRIQWNAPIRIDPHDPDVVYHAAQYVLRTRDAGMNWETVSPDLTRNDTEKQDFPGYPITNDATGVEVYDVIFSLEISPHERGVIWAGSDDGLVHVTRDNTATWTNVTPPTMPDFGVVNSIDISAHDPARAFISVYRYRQDDFRPYIFRTNDYGESWELLTDGTNGIPENHFVRVVREDPDRRGLLFAGTEFGLYVSFDDGAHWQPFQLDLPVSPVTDLRIHQKDLVVATQGRSFWVLDDLTPLHQLTDEVTDEVVSARTHLFTPRDTYRVQMNGRLRYGAESAPENPRDGVMIFYTFEEEPDGEVTLEILDRAGNVVQSFSSAKEAPGAPFDFRRAPQGDTIVSTKRGMNRFIWDFFYPGVQTAEGTIVWGYTGGIKASPGIYQVRLSAGDWSQTRSFELLPDPRRDISQADHDAQFELAQEIRERFNELFATLTKIRSVREQVEAMAGRATKAGYGEDLAEPAETLAAALTEIENELTQTKNESRQDALNFAPKLDGEFAALYGYVAQPDGRPTAGSYERFHDLEVQLEEIMARLDEIERSDLEAFNALLDEKGVPPVVVSR